MGSMGNGGTGGMRYMGNRDTGGMGYRGMGPMGNGAQGYKGYGQWRIQDFPGGYQLFTVSTYERHITSLHNQQAKT